MTLWYTTTSTLLATLLLATTNWTKYNYYIFCGVYIRSHGEHVWYQNSRGEGRELYFTGTNNNHNDYVAGEFKKQTKAQA